MWWHPDSTSVESREAEFKQCSFHNLCDLPIPNTEWGNARVELSVIKKSSCAAA